MLPDELNESTDNPILYELLIYTEWPQDPELQVRGSNEKHDEKYLAVKPWRWLGPLAPAACPPLIIQKLISQQMPWQFAIGREGRVIAVLQDQCLEIKSSRDEFGSVLGRIIVPRDHFPQWRKVVWAPDCSLLAFAHSNGCIEVYDLIGAPLYNIPNQNTIGKSNDDLGEAIVGMVFCDLRTKNTQWSYELLVANFKGEIKAYFVSPTDFQESHEFTVASHYPYGINTFLYHTPSQILIISGQTTRFSVTDTEINALQLGITSWRILIGKPYYKLSLSLEDEMSLQKTFFWQAFPRYWKAGMTSNQDLVHKMSFSPNQNVLAAIHVSGALSLWHLPQLRLNKFLDLTLQPSFSDMNPQYCEPGMKRKANAVLSNEYKFHLNEVNWWTDDAIILARSCGAVTVSATDSLKNLLGISPEWFEPYVQVSASHDRGFLAMECEKLTTTKKRSASEAYSIESDESSDEEELSFFGRAAGLTKQAMFYITDHDRFRPPRKKMRFINKTYRLLCLKSTTPEELFARKINNEEYGEALALAKTYNMDCDLVYQRQWRKTPASVATIQDYLSKITKRAWVLHECLERVPETIDAAKELLLFGLRGTDLQALISIGKGEDHGRFVAYQSFDDLMDEEYEDFMIDAEVEEERKQKLEKKRKELLRQINFSKLSLEQKQLCECRLKLLVYLDRLTTYEAVLGGPGIADGFYDHHFFRKFRCQSGLEACITFAHDSNWQAIAAMFTYHGEETLQHWLTILSSFPETTSPAEYQLLLPKLGYCDGKTTVFPWNEDEWRVADWCENKYERAIASPVSDDFVVDFYEDHKEYFKFRGTPTPHILSSWYIERAHVVESLSCLVDNALELVKLGMERNVQGLEKLLDKLTTLDTITYECQLEKDVVLIDLEQMDDFEIVQLLMSKSDEGNFIKHVRLWLLPYLNRCEKDKPGSRKELLPRYMIDVSKGNLNFCRKVIENSKRDRSDAIIASIEDQISLALDCIYICEKDDVLKDVCAILEHFPKRSNSTASSKAKLLQSRISDLEKHVRVGEIIEKNGSSVTLGFIKGCGENSEEITKLLTKLTRVAGRKYPHISEAAWSTLLTDILEIQKLFGLNVITKEQCYEIFLHSQLCCGRREAINYAGKMMTHSQQRRVKTHDNATLKLPYKNSVGLVLKASQEYFNSSASLTDPCMALAGFCLNLIEDSPPSIEEELDLIACLRLLQEFNVKILPLQVRLCTERLKLVEQAMKGKSKAYRSSVKLLKLAYLLRVCGDNKKEREGKVLTLVAEAAFEEKDYDPSLDACKHLMESGYEEGWTICYRLGQCKEFSNYNSRCELMSFALVHCTPDLLDDILKAKLELDLQVTCDRVKFLMGEDIQCETESNDITASHNGENNHLRSPDNGTNPFWQTGEKTLQVLQSTTQTTRSVLSSVQSARFWKDAIRWIKPGASPREEDFLGEKGQNKDLTLQGVCGFYSGLFENVHVTELITNYQRYALLDLNQSMEISSKLLRASLLEDTINGEIQKSGANSEVLLDLAEAYIPEDTMYGLSLLLGVQQHDKVEELFSKLPNTPVVLQLASLYYAIQIQSRIESFKLDFPVVEQPQNPFSIIKTVENFMNSQIFDVKSYDETTVKAFEHFKSYNKMLYDFVQAELLHSIGGGVDAARFTSDDIYKKETILGIAMTLEDRIFQIAVSLAQHYDVPLWDVHMAQLEFIFSDSSLSIETLDSRMEKLKLLDTLLTQRKKLQERMKTSLYPSIDGKDHAKLQKYFFLQELCSDDPDDMGIIPSTHKKLLTKFRIHKSLDYKKLMSGRESPLEYISSLLTESNVHVFAKSAAKIPNGNGSFLEPSSVYKLWVVKYFFYGSGSVAKEPKTMTEWLHRFDSCRDMLLRLNPKDFMDFINSTVFSVNSLEKLTVECRCEILKRSIKFCKQKDGKDKLGTVPEWKCVSMELHQYSKHLLRMDDTILLELKNSPDPRIASYMRDFDLSRSILPKLEHLLTRIVMDGPDLSLLKTFLSCCPPELKWEASDAYLQAIHSITNELRSDEIDSSSSEKLAMPTECLERVLCDISKNRDELMIDDIAIDVVYDFCQDPSVSISLRLQVLQLLEKTSYFTEEYSNLLLLYQSQAVVSSIWPNYEVSENDISDEIERKILFDKLISSSESFNHFCSLAQLLIHWPDFSTENANDCWTTVLSGLASLPEKAGLEKVLHFFQHAHSKKSISQQSCWKIYQRILPHQSVLHILKFAFKTDYEDLHLSAVNILKEHSALTRGDYDEELLNLILDQHLTVDVIGTSLYKPVIDYMFSHQEKYSVKAIVEELKNANYDAEAGSLMLIHSHMHPGLSTFSSALNILNRWLPKQKE